MEIGEEPGLHGLAKKVAVTLTVVNFAPYGLTRSLHAETRLMNQTLVAATMRMKGRNRRRVTT